MRLQHGAEGRLDKANAAEEGVDEGEYVDLWVGGRADDVYLLCAREGATMRVGEAIGVGEAATWGATVYGRGTQKICDGRR